MHLSHSEDHQALLPSNWLKTRPATADQITAIPRLLELLDLHGQIVTIDAMGTHTHIAAGIVEGGGDYVLVLKGNQGNLHQAVCDEFHFAICQLDLGKAEGWSHDSRRERSHGRDTRRTMVATTRLDFLDPEIRERWQGLASIIMVENETRVPGEEKVAARRVISSAARDAARRNSKITSARTGASKINVTGYWTPCFVRITTRRGSATPPRISVHCDESS